MKLLVTSMAQVAEKSPSRANRLLLCTFLAYSFYVLLWFIPFRHQLIGQNPLIVSFYTYLSLVAYYAFVPGYSIINLSFSKLNLPRKIFLSLGLNLSFFPIAAFFVNELEKMFNWWWLNQITPIILLIVSIFCLSLALLQELSS